MYVRARGGLPGIYKLSASSAGHEVKFVCPCGCKNTTYGHPEEDTSSVTVMCPSCHLGFQLRVFRRILADHGKPGTGR